MDRQTLCNIASRGVEIIRHTFSLTYFRQEGFGNSHHSKLVYIDLVDILIHCCEFSITKEIQCSIVH